MPAWRCWLLLGGWLLIGLRRAIGRKLGQTHWPRLAALYRSAKRANRLSQLPPSSTEN
jgi:hypothetical protein